MPPFDALQQWNRQRPPRLSCLNLPLLAETYLRRQFPGGCYDPLARYDGGQAGNGWRGLRDGMDDQRTGRTRGDRRGLDSRDLAGTILRSFTTRTNLENNRFMIPVDAKGSNLRPLPCEGN